MIKMVEVPFAGHPDKICDQIVEGILDEYVKRDAKSRLDIQALGSHGMLMIGGTVDSRADFDVATLAQTIYKDIGYDDEIEPFVNLERPSEDNARITVNGGAQGTSIVYGYATKETREFLPKPLVYANAIARRVEDFRRREDTFAFLRPDGKVQVAMEGGNVVAVTLLIQHDGEVQLKEIQSQVVEHIIWPAVGKDESIKLFVNSGGPFRVGGFAAASGSSGRKEHADTYGGLLPFGGASFMGKDPLKPARCGQYMARFAAKSLVARGVGGKVLISAAYTIGRSEPVFVEAQTDAGKDISQLVKEEFDFRPEAIVERLGLMQPMYGRVATYGQFGREGLPWEEIAKD